MHNAIPSLRICLGWIGTRSRKTTSGSRRRSGGLFLPSRDAVEMISVDFAGGPAPVAIAEAPRRPRGDGGMRRPESPRGYSSRFRAPGASNTLRGPRRPDPGWPSRAPTRRRRRGRGPPPSPGPKNRIQILIIKDLRRIGFGWQFLVADQGAPPRCPHRPPLRGDPSHREGPRAEEPKLSPEPRIEGDTLPRETMRRPRSAAPAAEWSARRSAAIRAVGNGRGAADDAFRRGSGGTSVAVRETRKGYPHRTYPLTRRPNSARTHNTRAPGNRGCPPRPTAADSRAALRGRVRQTS